jgi:hypothetical protein
MATYHLEPEIYYYTYAAHRPALRVQSGDIVISETRDAFGLDAARNPLPEGRKAALGRSTSRVQRKGICWPCTCARSS